MAEYFDDEKKLTVTTCSCGKHESVGETSPRERALIYNWSRQRGRSEFDRNQKQYLESYEAYHGPLASNEFIFNSDRFKKD